MRWLPRILLALILLPVPVEAQDAIYREKNQYPILDAIRAARDSARADRDSLRAMVEDQWKARREAERAGAKDLRLDWSKIRIPAGPEAFKAAWHTPPVAQYYTGTCWAYCATSFLESEAHRLHEVEAKLSEMWFVYWEYVEKARLHLESYGATPMEEGSQDHGVLEVLRIYGAVPAEAYAGVLAADGRHDHAPMLKELKAYLKWVLETGTIDPERTSRDVRAILDAHLGPVPEDFVWQDRSYTPRAFADQVLRLDPDRYVSCVSRLDRPFYTRVQLDVPDNWRRKADYFNLPLDDFYKVLFQAVSDGVTVTLGGDNSEPGMDGLYDAAVIPEWDIPARWINQASRELRITNGTTGDDHGVHAVGVLRHENRDWFLVKDSNRSSRLGKHQGYYFWDGDYIRLKMLTFMVDKERLGTLLD